MIHHTGKLWTCSCVVKCPNLVQETEKSLFFGRGGVSLAPPNKRQKSTFTQLILPPHFKFQ